jgi:phosphatidylserine/phosphatidylglycerophosphate/cardiolipin synthase-like enzyme
MTRAFFTSQESVEKELVRLIDKSHSTIDMALFRFASRPLALAIGRARARHVRVRIVLDGHSEAEGRNNSLEIAFATGEVRRLDGKRGGTQGIMHHKFVLFDKERVVTGSFNWTAGAEHVNYENALLTDNSNVVAAYGREFERLWGRAQNVAPGLMSAPLRNSRKLRIRITARKRLRVRPDLR